MPFLFACRSTMTIMKPQPGHILGSFLVRVHELRALYGATRSAPRPNYDSPPAPRCLPRVRNRILAIIEATATQV
jgi:hypothetical protein